jgi:hypothetical protein
MTSALDTTFTAAITTEKNSGWACVAVPDSAALFGTRNPVKIAGTVDGHPVQSTLMPMGNGVHMLPIKAALRKTLKKGVGDEVTVRFTERLG